MYPKANFGGATVVAVAANAAVMTADLFRWIRTVPRQMVSLLAIGAALVVAVPIEISILLSRHARHIGVVKAPEAALAGQ